MTKIIIIGASSSGATCAARLRRLNIQSEIVIYEKRPYLTLADDSYLAYLKGEIPSMTTVIGSILILLSAIIDIVFSINNNKKTVTN